LSEINNFDSGAFIGFSRRAYRALRMTLIERDCLT